MNLVLDASAVLDLLLNRPAAPLIQARLSSVRNLLAPFLLDAEVGQVLRKFVLKKQLSKERARQALEDFADLPIIRYPHLPLLGRAMDHLDNLTVYDALYLTLAEVTEAPLLTGDRAMAAAPGHGVRVEVVGS